MIKFFNIAILFLYCFILSGQDFPPPPPPDEDIFVLSEVMPRFPGCEQLDGTNEEKAKCAEKKMLKYIYTNLKYPAEARVYGISGQVVLKFVVDKNGKIGKVEVHRNPGGGLAEAVQSVVESMNNLPEPWSPGMQRGRPVSVWYTLPVKFGLAEDDIDNSGKENTSNSQSGQDVSSGPEIKTPIPYNFKLISLGSGDAAKTGDYVYFTAKITGDDGEILNEMMDETQLPNLLIPDKLPTGANSNPILEMIMKSKVGDIYHLTMPIEPGTYTSPEMTHLKFMVHEICIKRILNEEANKKLLEEQHAAFKIKAAAYKEKLPAIEELVKTALADYKLGKLKTKSTASGLKYYIVKKGEGDNAKAKSKLTTNYYGILMDGTLIDNSYTRGQEFTFPLGQGHVISGWDEGFTLLNKGSKALFFIPSELGYGETGSPPLIPANAELLFYVELEDINE
jgi:FKBP-type peptidyl-prolyl cis-trans isomerase FkpA